MRTALRLTLTLAFAGAWILLGTTNAVAQGNSTDGSWQTDDGMTLEDIYDELNESLPEGFVILDGDTELPPGTIIVDSFDELPSGFGSIDAAMMPPEEFLATVPPEYLFLFDPSLPVPAEFAFIDDLSLPVPAEYQFLYDPTLPVPPEFEFMYGGEIPVEAEVVEPKPDEASQTQADQTEADQTESNRSEVNRSEVEEPSIASPPTISSQDASSQDGSSQDGSSQDTARTPSVRSDGPESPVPMLPLLIFVGVASIAMLAFIPMALGRRSNSESALRKLALTDDLTQLANRRRLDRDLLSHHRAQQPIAVAMVDIDHFKRLNDDFGHATGDQVLQQVASTISQNVRKEDLVYRYGGEEFCVLLPDATEYEAAAVVDRARRAIESLSFDFLDRAVTVSAGVAVAQGTDPRGTGGETVRQADAALYAAKNTGRNRVLPSSLVT